MCYPFTRIPHFINRKSVSKVSKERGVRAVEGGRAPGVRARRPLLMTRHCRPRPTLYVYTQTEIIVAIKINSRLLVVCYNTNKFIKR
jgi:hypothetical protein